MKTKTTKAKTRDSAIDSDLRKRFRTVDGPDMVRACLRIFGAGVPFTYLMIERAAASNPDLAQTMNRIIATIPTEGRKVLKPGRRVRYILSKLMAGVDVDGWVIQPTGDTSAPDGRYPSWVVVRVEQVVRVRVPTTNAEPEISNGTSGDLPFSQTSILIEDVQALAAKVDRIERIVVGLAREWKVATN